MMTTDDSIKEDLPDDEVFDLPEAMEELIEIPKQASDSRSYLNQVHVENGYACATDAHVLAAVPVSTNGESKDYPAPEIHKTDSIRENGDGESLKVVCTHQTDKSGTIKPIPSDENSETFPDVQEVWPDTDGELRVRVNPEYLTRIAKIVGDTDEDSGIILSFCREQGDEDTPDGIDAASPVKITGPDGAGVVMPLRLRD